MPTIQTLLGYRPEPHAEGIEALARRAKAPDDLVEAYVAAVRAYQRSDHPSWPRIHAAIEGRWDKAERLRINRIARAVVDR